MSDKIKTAEPFTESDFREALSMVDVEQDKEYLAVVSKLQYSENRPRGYREAGFRVLGYRDEIDDETIEVQPRFGADVDKPLAVYRRQTVSKKQLSESILVENLKYHPKGGSVDYIDIREAKSLYVNAEISSGELVMTLQYLNHNPAGTTVADMDCRAVYVVQLRESNSKFSSKVLFSDGKYNYHCARITIKNKTDKPAVLKKLETLCVDKLRKGPETEEPLL